MEIYRIKDKPDIYVEIIDPPEWATPPSKPGDWVYVMTRTPYCTTVFGQLESAGWIDRSRLELIAGKNKKERELLKDIEEAIEEGKRRSELWYNLYKVTRKEEDKK